MTVRKEISNKTVTQIVLRTSFLQITLLPSETPHQKTSGLGFWTEIIISRVGAQSGTSMDSIEEARWLEILEKQKRLNSSSYIFGCVAVLSESEMFCDQVKSPVFCLT